MPDLFLVFAKRWKFIAGLTLAAALVALIIALVSPKKYLSTATALPANSLVSDKNRIFQKNIEILYSDFGSPDELDRLEGTGMLDTIFIATARTLSLGPHYGFENGGDGPARAAVELKKNTSIARSGYGELKVKVWDEDRQLAASIANTLIGQIQELHQHLQQQGNMLALQKLQEDERQKKEEYKNLSDSLPDLSGKHFDELALVHQSALLDRIRQDEDLIDQYRLAINTNPQALLTVENARPALWPDKPKVLPTVLFALGGAFLFSFLVALFLESRK